jgi:hypothetical protein
MVMNEYLAYPCAVGGGLRDALYASEVDDDLLHAAGEIIDALLMGGPAKDIHDYADAADVILRYLELLDSRAKEIDQYLVVDAILGYLTNNWDMDARWVNGWDAENRDQAIVLANRILSGSIKLSIMPLECFLWSRWLPAPQMNWAWARSIRLINAWILSYKISNIFLRRAGRSSLPVLKVQSFGIEIWP